MSTICGQAWDAARGVWEFVTCGDRDTPAARKQLQADVARRFPGRPARLVRQLPSGAYGVVKQHCANGCGCGCTTCKGRTPGALGRLVEALAAFLEDAGVSTDRPHKPAPGEPEGDDRTDAEAEQVVRDRYEGTDPWAPDTLENTRARRREAALRARQARPDPVTRSFRLMTRGY